MTNDAKNSYILVSIIIPTLNEAQSIRYCLKRLQSIRDRGCEIIVSDGGSSDGTASGIAAFTDHIVESSQGRARQMNAGSAVASGKWLLFLHADTLLPDNIDQWLEQLKTSNDQWGFFRVLLDGESVLFRMIENAINLRSSLTRVATGDQCLFVRRKLFSEGGLYPDIPLMEDVALSKNLRKSSRPMIWNMPVTTSSRRWQKKGVFKTIVLMWGLRLAYFLGVSPKRLYKIYYG